MRLAFGVVTLTAFHGCIIADSNGDGVTRACVVGASNEVGAYGVRPWPDRVFRNSLVDMRNFGAYGATAMPTGAAKPPDGMTQLADASAASCDFVMIALGSNDAIRAEEYGWSAWKIADRILLLGWVAHNRGMGVLLATIPMDGLVRGVQPRIDAINTLLRQNAGAWGLAPPIDFDSGLYWNDFAFDRLHLNDDGQAIIASRVRDAVTR